MKTTEVTDIKIGREILSQKMKNEKPLLLALQNEMIGRLYVRFPP